MSWTGFLYRGDSRGGWWLSFFFFFFSLSKDSVLCFSRWAASAASVVGLVGVALLCSFLHLVRLVLLRFVLQFVRVCLPIVFTLYCIVC